MTERERVGERMGGGHHDLYSRTETMTPVDFIEKRRMATRVSARVMGP